MGVTESVTESVTEASRFSEVVRARTVYTMTTHHRLVRAALCAPLLLLPPLLLFPRLASAQSRPGSDTSSATDAGAPPATSTAPAPAPAAEEADGGDQVVDLS